MRNKKVRLPISSYQRWIKTKEREREIECVDLYGNGHLDLLHRWRERERNAKEPGEYNSRLIAFII